MTQPENTSWSGAVQRELDGLNRSVDSRFVDLNSRLDKLLPLNEYNSDKRLFDLQFHNLEEKIDDVERDLETQKTEFRNAINELHREVAAERARYEAALASEVSNRQKDHNTYVEQRRSLFRWTVSMVMIPIALVLLQIILKK